MGTFQSFALLLFCCAGAFCFSQEPLSEREMRLEFSKASKLSSHLFVVLLPTRANSSDERPFISIDTVALQLRTFLLQSKNIPQDAPLWELDYYYSYEFCFLWYTMVHQKLLSSHENEWNGHNLVKLRRHSILIPEHVPKFLWDSPNFLFADTDDDSHYERQFHGVTYTIENMNITTAANYEFIPDLGIQVSNLTMNFTMDHLGIHCGKHLEVWDNGTIDDFGSIDRNPTEAMLTDWEESKVDYENEFQLQINCFLSNGLVSSDCEREEAEGLDPRLVRYNRMSVMQLFQGMGLGALQ